MTDLRAYLSAKRLLLASILTYLACLPMDSFCASGNCSGWPSWSVLAFGWLEGILYLPAAASWYANPTLFLAWLSIALAWRRTALVFAITAALLAAWFMAVDKVAVSESGSLSTVTGLALGYWLWLASMTLAVASAALIRPKTPAQTTAVAP